MSHLTILNIFNHLCASVAYVDTSQKAVTARRKNVLRNILPIGCTIIMFCYFGLVTTVRNLGDMVETTVEIVHLLKYSINAQIMFQVAGWMYRYSGKVVSLYRNMIDVDNTLQSLHPTAAFQVERHLTLKLLILLAFLLRASIFGYHHYLLTAFGVFKTDIYLILQGNVLLELIMDLEKVYLAFFAAHLAKRYGCIAQLMHTSDPLRLRAVFEVFCQLLTLKGRMSQTLGLLMLFMVLETFVACSTHAYLMMTMFVLDIPFIHMLEDAGQLTHRLALFYFLTYSYDSIERKEAELRNALKSIQYIKFQDQTCEQKDFYDLINLKLMMDSPKITACGLFEINLQIFYNVFAAIITYIVILFQFRGFEKAP